MLDALLGVRKETEKQLKFKQRQLDDQVFKVEKLGEQIESLKVFIEKDADQIIALNKLLDVIDKEIADVQDKTSETTEA